MKKVLITGANSFIGTSFQNYIEKNFPNDLVIDVIDMIDGTWVEKDFSEYDSVYHVAGIAHSDNGNISKEKEELYFKVNTDLTIKVAEKAKASGVKQFVFMSSAIVYGESASLNKCKTITASTPTAPNNCYSKSKVMAENGILPLNDDNFKVVILRPPMVYGKGSKGNYPLLSKIARKLPIFPSFENKRSMLYIENLCEFVRLVIVNEENGIFWPQNSEYSNTTHLVKLIAEKHNKRIIIVNGFGWCIKLLGKITRLANKAFGSFCYDMAMSEYKENYRVVDLDESIERTERD